MYTGMLARMMHCVQEVFRLLSDGVICPYMGKTYPLDEVKDALKASSGVAHGGKVYLSN